MRSLRNKSWKRKSEIEKQSKEMGDEKVKAEALQIIGAFQVLPRLVVFDLDYTLWPFYWYSLLLLFLLLLHIYTIKHIINYCIYVNDSSMTKESSFLFFLSNLNKVKLLGTTHYNFCSIKCCRLM